jgi:hypothetical protein
VPLIAELCARNSERVLQSYESYRVQRRDVEDVINSLLERDPEQLRSTSLSWDPLMEVLGNQAFSSPRTT